MQTQTPITGLQYIAGQWIASNLQTFVSRNPARREEFVGVFPVASAAEVQRAVTEARRAFPDWRDAGRSTRAGYLSRFADLLNRESDRFAELMARETGRPIRECRVEIQVTARRAQHTLGDPGPPLTPLSTSHSGVEQLRSRQPLGVVAVLGPWTFPLGSPIGMLISALIEGNSVVLKPSEDAPATAHRAVELFAEAGIPAGVLNLLHGDGFVGEALVRSPEVEGVLFTGGPEVARRVRQLSTEVPGRRLGMSIGGTSVSIVCEDADLDTAAQYTAEDAFRSAGQRCDSLGRVLVAQPVLDELIERFIERATLLRVGEPLDPDTDLGPMLNEPTAERVIEYQHLARREGAEVILDGARLTGEPYRQGCYVSPFACCVTGKAAERILRFTVSGPFVVVVPFTNLDEAIERLRAMAIGQTLSVFTNDYRTARQVRHACPVRAGFLNSSCLSEEAYRSPAVTNPEAVAMDAFWTMR